MTPTAPLPCTCGPTKSAPACRLCCGSLPFSSPLPDECTCGGDGPARRDTHGGKVDSVRGGRRRGVAPDVSGLRASVCMWPRLPRVCAAQAMPVGHGLLVVVAQRVSYTTKVCAHTIKDVPVAQVCRVAAGLPPPSPLDDRRAMVSWARMAPREHETRTGGVVPGPWPWAPKTVLSPSWMHI